MVPLFYRSPSLRVFFSYRSLHLSFRSVRFSRRVLYHLSSQFVTLHFFIYLICHRDPKTFPSNSHGNHYRLTLFTTTVFDFTPPPLLTHPPSFHHCGSHLSKTFDRLFPFSLSRLRYPPKNKQNVNDSFLNS